MDAVWFATDVAIAFCTVSIKDCHVGPYNLADCIVSFVRGALVYEVDPYLSSLLPLVRMHLQYKSII